MSTKTDKRFWGMLIGMIVVGAIVSIVVGVVVIIVVSAVIGLGIGGCCGYCVKKKYMDVVDTLTEPEKITFRVSVLVGQFDNILRKYGREIASTALEMVVLAARRAFVIFKERPLVLMKQYRRLGSRR